MALPSARFEFRLTLSDADRGVSVQQSAIVARHPSETAEHLILRVLAFCLLFEERLEFGPGLSDPEAADLVAHDLTGRITTWIECGAADADKVRKVLLHNTEATVHAVLCEPRRHDELAAGIAAWKKPPRGRSRLGIWTIARELVAALASREGRRQTWTVTLVGGHAYIEADGLSVDGPVETTWPLAD
jgi:uncharacterized protein YaeQ